MARYYVNKNGQPNGDHEVHTTGCSRLPDAVNRIYLGAFIPAHQRLQKRVSTIYR